MSSEDSSGHDGPKTSQARKKTRPKSRTKPKHAVAARETIETDELEEKGEEIVETINAYAAQKPLTFLAIGLAAGFIIGRMR